MSNDIDVKKVAELAKIHLPESEEQYYQEQFQKVLNYFDLLSQVDTESIASMPKDESLQNLFRDDVMERSSVHPEDFSPYVENHFLKVPKVIE